METTLYTLGHSTHPLPHVLRLLTRHGITAVADVRSTPYRRRSPQWNRESVQKALTPYRIAYTR